VLRLTLALGLISTLAGCTTSPDADPAKGTTAPFYSCYRHIYNNSSCPWTFQIPQETQYGNVYFGDGTLPNCTQMNGPCTVAGNTTIEIHYTYTRGSSQGVYNITDRTGTKRDFSYSAPTAAQCPYIRHAGGTGAVALNDPADGDINVWGACTWADGENKPWQMRQSGPRR